MNWAFKKDSADDEANHVHIFVGDLSGEVNDAALFQVGG